MAAEVEAGGAAPASAAEAAPDAARDTRAPRLGTARLALLALGCLVLFLAGSARIGVVDRDEARFALAVREMADRGDWLVPTNWGELRHQKPILAYWLGLASWSALGRSELALRLPSALCVTGAVLLTAAAAGRRFGRRVGWRAGWILATALLVVVQAHAFTADPALLLGTTLSFWAWARVRGAPERAGPARLALWLGVAVGALAKLVNVAFLAAAAVALVLMRAAASPALARALVAGVAVGALAVAVPGLGGVGVGVLAALAAFAGLRLLRDPGARASIGPLGWRWGPALALALLAAWGIPALVATEGRFWSLGVEGDLLARTARPFEGHWGVPGYYLATTLIVFFPWGALLPRALVTAWRMRDAADVRFLLAWIVGPWVLLELVTSKLPHYMLVTFPALAVFVALELERRRRSPGPGGGPSRDAAGSEPVGRAGRLFEAAVAAAPAGVLAVGGVVIAVAFGRVGIALVALAFTALGIGVAVRLARALGRSGGGDVFPTLATSAAALYLAAFGLLFPALEPVRIAEPLGRAVARHLRPGERLWVHDFRHASVGYALPVAGELLHDPRDVVPALTSGPSLLVVPNGPEKPRLDAILAEHPVAIEHVDTVRGRVLWRLREREIWLVRAASGPGPGSPGATDPGSPAATSPGSPAATSPGSPAATSPGSPAGTGSGAPTGTGSGSPASEPETGAPASGG